MRFWDMLRCQLAVRVRLVPEHRGPAKGTELLDVMILGAWAVMCQ